MYEGGCACARVFLWGKGKVEFAHVNAALMI